MVSAAGPKFNLVPLPGNAMQSVIFACPQCGKEMAVAEELFGMEVRCPHCKQAVQAPSAVPAAVPIAETADGGASAPSLLGDSIFDAPTDGDPSLSAGAGTTTAFLPSEGDTANGGAAQPRFNDPTTEFLVPEKDRMAVLDSPTDFESTEVDAAGANASSPPPRPRSPLAGYLLAILIPYAILATIATVWLYFKTQSAVHPLEMLPDWPRDNERPARPGDTFQRVDDRAPLPARLRVGLGKTIRVGDLEITPTQLERRRIIFSYERTQRNDEPSRQPSLVLTLRVRNCATNTAFAPNDLFFNRKWRDGMPAANRPYTCLEVGESRFYGGPCDWKPRAASDNGPREFVAGSAFDKVLQPGAESSYLICTDPENAGILEAVELADGPLLWRVQVRRGVVRAGNRETTATAVVGIEFTAKNILERN